MKMDCDFEQPRPASTIHIHNFYFEYNVYVSFGDYHFFRNVYLSYIILEHAKQLSQDVLRDDCFFIAEVQ